MDLDKMSLAELRVLAKEKGMKSITALKKSELVERIKAEENKAAENQE